MSIDMTIVKQEPRTDSPGLPEDIYTKNSKTFDVVTEFVRIKEEISEDHQSDGRIKQENSDDDEIPLSNLDKTFSLQSSVKVEITVENNPTASINNIEEKSHEDNTEIPKQAPTVNSDLNVGNIPNYLNEVLEKRFDEGSYTNELHNTFQNYFANTSIGNGILNPLIAGIENKMQKRISAKSKSRKTKNEEMKKKKINGILNKLYRESLKKNAMGDVLNGGENAALFAKNVKAVDIVTTPEIKNEACDIDSDSGASNPAQVFTIREGFPVPEYQLDDRICPVCHEKFSSAANVQRHFYIHTRERNYECKVCNIKFWRRQELTKHMYRHDIREHECEICQRRFKSKSNLNQHIKCHTVRYDCTICEKSYVSEAQYQKHMNRKLCRRKGALLRCSVCFKGFKYECSLKCHLRKHSPDRPYICDMCSMGFVTKIEMESHIYLHTMARPFKCAVCPKRFANMAFRRAHMRIHTGEKPFQCPVCKRFFTHKHNMERHLERHGKVKKLVCDVCGRKFPRESRLVYHMRCHFDQRPFSCNICPKKFAHKQNVVKHYSRKHPGSVYTTSETDASVAYKTWHSIQDKLITVRDGENEEILG